MLLPSPGNMRGTSIRHLACASIALASAAASPGLAQQPIWVESFGTPLEDEVSASAPDGGTGAIVGGITRGALGAANAGTYDVWFAGFEASGERRWVKQIGSAGSDRVEDMAPDGAGGAYACGMTTGDLAALGQGSTDGWVARLDGQGTTLWIQQLGTSQYDYAMALAQDGAGGAYLAGATGGALYGPNQGTPGSTDLFLTRYDAAGVTAWSIQFGSGASEFPGAAAPAPAGGVFLAGHTYGALAGPHAGAADAFVMRLDGAGALLWSLQFGTPTTDGVSCATPDGAGGVYVAGHTLGDLGGPLVGGYDVWLARFDGDGRRLWLRQFGEPTEQNVPRALVPADAGGVLLAGSSELGLFTGVPWLTRFDALGNQAWQVDSPFGHALDAWSHAASPDGSGGLFVGGRVGRKGTLASRAWLSRYAID